MVDIDPTELEKMAGTVHFPICADAGDFMRAMIAQKFRYSNKEENPVEREMRRLESALSARTSRNTRSQRAG